MEKGLLGIEQLASASDKDLNRHMDFRRKQYPALDEFHTGLSPQETERMDRNILRALGEEYKLNLS